MYYHIKVIKNAVIKSIPFSEKESRKDMKKTLSLSNIIDSAMKYNLKIGFQGNNPLISKALFHRAIDTNEYDHIFNDLSSLSGYDIDESFVPTDKKKLFSIISAELPNKPRVKKKPNQDKSLISINKMFKIVEKCLKGEESFVFFDLEAYEKNTELLTEVGILTSTHDNKFKLKHYIIEEHIDKLNHQWVPNNKSNFNYGKSEIVSLEHAMSELNEAVRKSSYVIGHGIHNDFKMITKAGFKLMERPIICTAQLSRILTMNLSDKKPYIMGMENCLKHFKLPYKHLHNAGNDCMYNFTVLQELLTVHKNTLTKQNVKKSKNKMK
jgi:hypothetical protein